MKEEKYFKCLSEDYNNHKKGKIYPGGLKYSECASFVYELVELFPEDWQEVSKEAFEAQENPEKYYKCLATDYLLLQKGKIYPCSHNDGVSYVYEFAEKYPGEWQEVSKSEYEAQEQPEYNLTAEKLIELARLLEQYQEAKTELENKAKEYKVKIEL